MNQTQGLSAFPKKMPGAEQAWRAIWEEYAGGATGELDSPALL